MQGQARKKRKDDPSALNGSGPKIKPVDNDAMTHY